MPISEASLDAPRDLVRLRYPSFTGNLRGVDFVDGVAQSGCAEHTARALIGIIGPSLSIVGPWGARPPAERPTPPPRVEAPDPPDPPAPAPPVPVPVAEPPIEPFARVSRASRGR